LYKADNLVLFFNVDLCKLNSAHFYLYDEKKIIRLSRRIIF